MREALTDQDDDEQPLQSTPAVTITQPRPDQAPRVATDQATDAPAPTSESDIVLEQLRAAGLPLDMDAPLGEVVLSTGVRLTLRELDGEDETVMESFLDQYNVKPDGAGQSTALRFSALMSISHEDGREQAPVRHVQQLQRLLKYKRRDIIKIVAGYIRYNLSNAEGTGTFRPHG